MCVLLVSMCWEFYSQIVKSKLHKKKMPEPTLSNMEIHFFRSQFDYLRV